MILVVDITRQNRVGGKVKNGNGVMGGNVWFYSWGNGIILGEKWINNWDLLGYLVRLNYDLGSNVLEFPDIFLLLTHKGGYVTIT